MTFEEWWKTLITRDYTRNNIELQDIAELAWNAAQSQQKPSWKDAPEWANYRAMDEDGEWFWYEKEPILNESEGMLKNYDVDNIFIKYESAKLYGVCWYKSLEKRP
jgi:hypothetical protein